MSKKMWIGAAVVFVVFFILDYIIHQVILSSAYEETANLWRSPEETKMVVMVIVGLIFAFFFVFIFSKGYEGKGVMEGVRYGFYLSMLVNIPFAYGMYAVSPIPYSLALQWFIYGTLEFLIAGAVLAAVMGSGGGGGTSEE